MAMCGTFGNYAIVPEICAMVFKRPRKPVEEWYAVMPLDFLIDILEDMDIR